MHLDDGTHLHGVDLRFPGAPPIGIGYLQQRDRPLIELRAVTARGKHSAPAAYLRRRRSILWA